MSLLGENGLLSEKIRNSVLKEFIATAIHVFWSNFTEIGCRQVGETMCCFGVKKFANAFFSPPFCARLVTGTKRLRDACHVTYISLENFVPIASDLPALFPNK